MSKNKTLNEVIDSFMRSQTYSLMISNFQNQEYETIQDEFHNKLNELESIAANKDFENAAINYLGATEKLGILVGFQFAFNLLQDLNNFEKESIGGESL